MPNGSGHASLLSSTLLKRKVKDLIEASAALRRLKEADATITIKSIPFDRLRLAALCDSGLDTKGVGQGRSQTGNMICAVDKDLLAGKEADLSILTWHSHKTDRAGSSTLAVEPNAMSEGLAEAEWVTS